MKSIILDLDGTLCDIGHRESLAQAKEWEQFNALCHLDKPNMDVAALVSIISTFQHFGIIVVTGRTEKYRHVTSLWLQEHHLYIDALVMRPENDFTSSPVLKLRQLEELFGSKENVLAQVAFALDDRDKIVEAFRNYGIPCWQVRPGGY